MNLKVDDDHWAFLEDIEAPMWVDLSLEANSKDQAIDDDWFYTTHQFHQCSSSQLKSAFSHLGDESSSSSPKLPNSISKSRGKEYKSKNWKGDNQDFLSNKSHPVKALTEKSSCVTRGGKNIVKPKISFVRPKEASSPRTSIVGESSNGSKLPSESKPTSTITSENGQTQQLKIADVSSQAFGRSNGFLSIMKKSLRKSYTTRQAVRVEINNEGKQLQGRNSTSSKSSIGSSSNPRSGATISISRSVRPKEITPDSRNAARMTYLTKSKVNADEGTSNNKRGQNGTAKSHSEAANHKVQYRDSRAKALMPSRINERNSSLEAIKLKKKTGIDGSNKLAGYGKENTRVRTSVTGCGKENVRGKTSVTGNGKDNVRGRTSVSQKKTDDKVIPGGESIEIRARKETRETRLGLNGKSGTIANKGKLRGQVNLDKPKSMVQRVHFR